MGRRHEPRRPSRRQPFREVLPRILVVCEGRDTEPQYFRGFHAACKNPRVKIEIGDEHSVDPKTLVAFAKQKQRKADRIAARERDDNLKYDEVWCVFDIDDHHGVTDAVIHARDSGILLAISNPSFELWLLLHFRESPGMQERQHIKAMLSEHVQGYDKKVKYAEYASGYEDAVKRAARLDALANSIGSEGCNPTTGVYLLTESIRGPNSRTGADGDS